MKKEELKNKAKGFWEKNGEAIIYAGFCGLCFMGGGLYMKHNISKKLGGKTIITNRKLDEFLSEVQNACITDKTEIASFMYTFEEPVKAEQLGKLGKKMVETAKGTQFEGKEELQYFLGFVPIER